MAKRICSIETCENVHLARGWCRKHYAKWDRHGDPLWQFASVADPVGFFWSKVNKNGPMPERGSIADLRGLGRCWQWTGLLNDEGYGHIYLPGFGDVRSHRFAYMQLIGDIPDPLVPDHLCRNRACANVGHLEIVTVAENNLRGLKSGPPLKTHCIYGHEFTPENTYVVPTTKYRQCVACRKRRDDARPRKRAA
jgi:hypothetical protein